MLIAFDTSAAHCTVVIAAPETGAVLAARHEHLVRGHAEHLMPLCQETMAEAGVAWADISLIGCTTGPGSFTGLRVALAAARGFALATGCATVGVGVLDVLARGRPCTVAQDARRSQVWMQSFAVAETGEQISDAPRAIAVDDALDYLKPTPQLLVGSGAPLLVERGYAGALDNPQGTVFPTMLAAACANKRRETGPLTPLYLRAADAKPQAALIGGAPPVLPHSAP